MKFYADAYRRDDPDRRFLQSREWRERIRPRALFTEPLCRFCRHLGVVKEAEHVDHIRRPKGDKTLQRDPNNFQGLCAEHHLLKSNWERAGRNKPLTIGYDRDGWPVTIRGGTLPKPGDDFEQPAPSRKYHKPVEKRFGVASLHPAATFPASAAQ
jgi:5-methylcytosine-specific restriction enzyme A